MLNPNQLKCISLLINGMTQKAVAKEIGVCEDTICNWKKDDEFMLEYTSSLKQSMKSVAVKAFQTEVKLLSARSENVRLAAAKDILDRAGFKPDENMNINGIGKIVIIDDCDQ